MDVIEPSERPSADCQVREDSETDKVCESEKNNLKGSPITASGLDTNQEPSDNEKVNDLPNAESIVESNQTEVPVALHDERTLKSLDNNTPNDVLGNAEEERNVSTKSETQSINHSTQIPSEVQISSTESLLKMETATAEVSNSQEKIPQKTEEEKNDVAEPETNVKEEKIPLKPDSELGSREKFQEDKEIAPESVGKSNLEGVPPESDSELSSGERHEDLPSLEDSEYETPEPEDDDIEKEDDEDDSNASESGESSTGSQVLTEREDGDGQESEKKDKKLDHDEDKRDPQYIPKKGNFYEHDDRTSETDEGSQKKPSPQKPYETKERWNHDLYDEDLQSPKSRQELIDQYGYDIRKEEGPPKARRRRRYGRGPNKYTRSWEEMEAYTKSRGSWRGRGRGRPISTPRNTEEEFPPLPTRKLSDRLQKRSDKKSEDKKEEPPPSVSPPPQNKETPPPQTKETPPPQKKESMPHKKSELKEEDEKKDSPQPVPVKKTFKQVFVEEQVIVSSSRGRGRGRGRLPPGAPFKTQGHHSHNHHQHHHHHHHQQHHSKQSTAEEDIATLSQHFSEAVINVDNKSIMPISTQQQQQQQPQQHQSRASSLPPTSSTMQSSSQVQTTHTVPSQGHAHPSERAHEDREAMIEKSESKSKRYSTQRQRSLPQGSPQVQQPPPQVQQPPQRYIQDQFFHQVGMEPSAAVAAPPPPPPQFTQPPPPAPQFTPEVPMMAFIPPGGQFQPLYVPPPPYLPPAPLPVQPAPPARPELYQGASGITYYNTQTQVNRPVSTSRRVKLAIPIVAPPESSS